MVNPKEISLIMMDAKLRTTTHTFRRKGENGLPVCNSKFCHCQCNSGVTFLRCRSCNDSIHSDCLGFLPETTLPKHFVCSGCSSKETVKVRKEKYGTLGRKLRRQSHYLHMICLGVLASWRMASFLKGGQAKRNLNYGVVCSFVDDNQIDELMQVLDGYVTEWKMDLTSSDKLTLCFNVLLPEALIKIIMDTENVHRDHAEHIYIKSAYSAY